MTSAALLRRCLRVGTSPVGIGVKGSSSMKISPAEQWLDTLSPSRTRERASEINWLAYTLAFWTNEKNLRSVSERDHFRILSGEPTPLLNQVSWGGLPVDDLKSRVFEITREMATEIGKPNIPCEWFTVGTHGDKAELEAALAAAGWEWSSDVPGMTCPLGSVCSKPSLKSDLSIQPVRTSTDVGEWLSPFLEGFHLHPESRDYFHEAFSRVVANESHPFRHYSLRYRGEVITTGSIQFRYGVAVIYNICTLTSARNLGGATAMVSFLKNVASESGYESVSLFALEAGRKIYEKLGFSTNSAVTRTFRFTT